MAEPQSRIHQESPGPTPPKPARTATYSDTTDPQRPIPQPPETAPILSTTTFQNQPLPTTSKSTKPSVFRGRRPVFSPPTREEKIPPTTQPPPSQAPPNRTQPNRTEQPYGWISPQIAPAGSRITQNRPSPSSLGPSRTSPPRFFTRSTLESRSSTLM